MNIEQYADTPFNDPESMHDFLFANEIDHYRIASFLRQNGLAITEVPLGANEGPTQSWLTDHYNTHADIGYRLNIQVPDLSGYDLSKEEDHVEWMEVHSATHQLIAAAINAYVPKLNAGSVNIPITYPGPSGPTDPYWTDVRLLLKFENGNGSSVLFDSSSYATNATVPSPGSSVVSTLAAAFGTGSFLITKQDGGGGQWSGSFYGRPAGTPTTYEFFYKWVSSYAATQSPPLFILSNSGSNYFSLSQYASGNQLAMQVGSSAASIVSYTPSGGFDHIAIEMDASNNVSVSYAGVLIYGPVSLGGSSLTTGTLLSVGPTSHTNTGYVCDVFVDNFRFTYNVLRYPTFPFTPPSTDFPTS